MPSSASPRRFRTLDFPGARFVRAFPVLEINCARLGTYRDFLVKRYDGHRPTLTAVGGAAGSRRSLSRSPARHTMGALRDLDGRRRVERAEFVGIADRHAAHHTVVIDDVLTEPPQRG